MEIKLTRKFAQDDYLLVIIAILLGITTSMVIYMIIKQKPAWVNIGAVFIQGYVFRGAIKSHLKAKKEKRETVQKYIKEEYARKQILNQCQKCSYYQGQIHGGNLLVCAMHPYGQEDCPDYK